MQWRAGAKHWLQACHLLTQIILSYSYFGCYFLSLLFRPVRCLLNCAQRIKKTGPFLISIYTNFTKMMQCLS